MLLGEGQSLKPPYRVAFTLTELLMALTIVGVLAVLTVPILINNFQNRLFATQIKNFSAEIEQFAQDQLITHKTRDLFDTDFGEPSKLLTDGHFSIVKICTAKDTSKDCWKITAKGKDKVTYKTLNGSEVAYSRRITVILKNGVMFNYAILGSGDGIFGVDVNGNDKPNIAGRDLFGFIVNSKGHVRYYSPNSTHSDKVTNCKSHRNAALYCYDALVDNNWKMDY